MPWTRKGKWRYSCTILDLGTRLEWSASRPAILPPEMEATVPLGTRLDVPQSQSGRYGEEKSLFKFQMLYIIKHQDCFFPRRYQFMLLLSLIEVTQVQTKLNILYNIEHTKRIATCDLKHRRKQWEAVENLIWALILGWTKNYNYITSLCNALRIVSDQSGLS
jgi:hypothetical protein